MHNPNKPNLQYLKARLPISRPSAFRNLKSNMFHKLTFILLASLLIVSPSFAKNKGKPPKTLNQKVITSVWTRALKSASKKRFFPEVASPLAVNGRIFVGTHSGIFYGIDETDGKIIWKFQSNGPIASKPVANDSLVFFGNNKGTVYALDQATGQKAWEYFVGGEVLGRPALSGNSLYVVTTSREVYSLSTDSGTQRWVQYVKGFEKKFTMRGNSAIIISGDRLYIGFADGQAVAMSASSGSILWSQNLSIGYATFKDVDADMLLDNGSIYIVGYFGVLARLDRGSGRIVWKKEISSGTNMAVDASTLYLSTAEGAVIAFDKTNGIRRWEVPLHSGALSGPTLYDGLLLVGAANNKGYIFDKSNGKLLQAIPLSRGHWGIMEKTSNGVYLLAGGARLYSLARTAAPAESVAQEEEEEEDKKEE